MPSAKVIRMNKMVLTRILGFPGGSVGIRLQCGRPGFDLWVGKTRILKRVGMEQSGC